MTERVERSDAGPDGDPVAMFHRRYLAALALVASLLVLNQALVQPPLLRLETDAPVINVAGRQRMLSQRLAKAALALDRARDAPSRRRHVAELAQVLSSWSASHDRLRRGDLGRPSGGPHSAALQAAFDGLQPSFAALRAAASRIIHASSGRQDGGRAQSEDLAMILGNEADYLTRMDQIVGLYEREARTRVERLRRTGWVVTALILTALAGLGRFVLRPAASLIRRQVAELREARDALEVRVRARTAALVRANRDLEREAHERSLAEARHRNLLEQFGHASRTNTLGEMATGLAHELNQPLGAIAIYVEGCLITLDAPRPALDEVRAALEKILATTMRAGEIIKRIRGFVTRHEFEPEPLAPNRLVEEVEQLLRDEARRRQISVRMDLAPDLPDLTGDPIQVQQVLVNLVRNAMESLSASQTVDPTVLMRTRTTDSNAVEFDVIDNGEGIPNDRIGHIFDAFFSTRAGGMGMGLAISRRIVEAHHGRIAAESEPGVRTIFRVTLPPAGGDDAATDRLHRGR